MATVVPAPVGSTGWGTAFANLMEAIADPGKKKREALLAERRSTAITKGAEFEAQLSEASTRLTGYQESVAKSQAASAETNAQIAKLQLEMSEAQKKVMDASPAEVRNSILWGLEKNRLEGQLSQKQLELADSQIALQAAQATAIGLGKALQDTRTITPSEASKLKDERVIDNETYLDVLNNTSRGAPSEFRPSPGNLREKDNPSKWYRTDPGTRDTFNYTFLVAYKKWLKGDSDTNSQYMARIWADEMYKNGYVFDPKTLTYEVRPDWQGPPPLMPQGQGAGTGTKSQAAPEATDQSAWKIPGY